MPSFRMSPRAQQVVALLKAIETGAQEPVQVINPTKYVQHNLLVSDGLAGFGELLKQLPKGSAKVNTVRAFEGGDFVFTHTEYNFFGPRIGFDIFRFGGRNDGMLSRSSRETVRLRKVARSPPSRYVCAVGRWVARTPANEARKTR